MTSHLKTLAVVLVLALITPARARELPLHELKLPPRFQIEVYADGIQGARSMAISPNGVLYVGSREEGRVYAILDKDNDGKADRVKTILRGLKSPNGVALRNGALYVAEISRVSRYDDIDARLEAAVEGIVIKDDFPKNPHHGWKFIRFGPDDKLYVPVGAPCNICESDNPVFASITRMNPDGTGFEVYAHGVRNTVGFDWHPGSKQLWFTDNGRDRMGDDIPPDELNTAPGHAFRVSVLPCWQHR
jgi:glucose/arabinose dehydrogenase